MVENQQKTIIITTHYIEEANEANFVSVLYTRVKYMETFSQY